MVFIDNPFWSITASIGLNCTKKNISRKRIADISKNVECFYKRISRIFRKGLKISQINCAYISACELYIISAKVTCLSKTRSVSIKYYSKKKKKFSTFCPFLSPKAEFWIRVCLCACKKMIKQRMQRATAMTFGLFPLNQNCRSVPTNTPTWNLFVCMCEYSWKRQRDGS